MIVTNVTFSVGIIVSWIDETRHLNSFLNSELVTRQNPVADAAGFCYIEKNRKYSSFLQISIDIGDTL